MDDLLDLNFTSSSSSTSTRPSSAKPYPSLAFDSISRSAAPNYYGSSSSGPSRSVTPLTAPIPQLSRLAQPPRPTSGSGERQPTPKLSNDAFSSLLSFDSADTLNRKESMAERASRLDREKRDSAKREKEHFENGDFWDKVGGDKVLPGVKPGGFTGFEELLQPQASSSRIMPKPDAQTPILAPTPSMGKSSKGSFWDMENGLASKADPPSAIVRSSQVDSLDPFDFDLLVSSPSKPNMTNIKTSSDDWGPGESLPSQASKTTSRPPRVTPRPSSPPPHVVGQIVEMGFSPAQARAGLAKTESGLDVSAALELLLGAGTSSQSPPHDELEEDDGDFIQQEREEAERERRRARRAGPSRESVRTKDDIRSALPSGRGTPELGEQAEKYLNQASEIGTNVLSKATSFWAASKDKAQKLYEEQKRVYEAQQAAKTKGEAKPAIRDGRPRWMIDAEAAGADGEEKEQKEEQGGFRDDEESPVRPARNGRSINAQPVETYRSVKERAGLLFADESPPYIPASRRKIPEADPSRRPPVAPIQREQTPAPLVQRNIITASPTQVQRATAAKAKGNDHFKLGRFSESESAYSIAISSLPPDHLLLIALHNNRAASRLKLGQSDAAVEDCVAVLTIIGPHYHPAKEAPLPLEHSDVKLPDSMVKALIKRAQAYEMGEKWQRALEDWEKVLGLDASFIGSGSATKNLAAEGARRARKMLEGDSVPAKAVIKPKPKAPVRPAPPSTAVKELRQANIAQEQEDAERLRLKDSVEAKLLAWKGGKETNLRALIASLDTVLWEGITGGVKVGMHELISEKQVKIRYMKVIARLHPDKLDIKNTTVEQRMLANGVFGTLNEAWQAFQNGS